MIRKIGVIYQDANSLGFLKGLQSRLDCGAELMPPTVAIGRSSTMTRRQAKLAWQQFRHAGVDAIIRFTDADKARWQDTRRQELDVFPDEARVMLICGVASANVEDWLALDLHYLAGRLQIDEERLRASDSRTGRIKAQLKRIKQSEENASDVVARIVAEAPAEVFRTWLKDESLRTFYEDCRAAAISAGCAVKNEL